jgi:Ca-activated chloride channel family protein
MMSDLTSCFELETSTGRILPFKGAHVDARLFGLLAVVELKQQWCNTGSEAIEALYTFPLAANAQLIGLSMCIGERSLEGMVQPKSSATARYEEAISEGQRAALVTDVGDDLKQIALGNIQPGDDISITLRWVEPLRWSDKYLRWRLPTVIAPRYGNPQHAGLSAGQAPHTDLLARYDLTLKVCLEGELARTRVSCPTHSVAVSKTDSQLLLQLAADARLDRDFVLNLQADAPQAAELWTCKGEQGASALLSFQPPMIATPMQAGQTLVALVDCSGSMGGDSIHQAREGLKAYLGMARPQDRLSIIRFGSSLSHCTPEPVRLDEQGRALLARKIDSEVEADLGGTEIIGALHEAVRIAGEVGQILLITDGEVYTSAEDLAGVVAGQCRIFPVGVGSAVSEQFLRDLADKTGGYLELVTPNENMAQVISAQCRRLTLSPVTAEVTWQQAPDWVEQGSARMFVGDSVLLAAKGNDLAIASLTLHSEGNQQQITVARRELDGSLGDVLRRYCSARCLPTLSDEKATALAVEEGLLCQHTAMVAVDQEKHATDGLPKLVEVAQMMAAGSHGFGSVCESVPDMHMSMCIRSESRSFGLASPPTMYESMDMCMEMDMSMESGGASNIPDMDLLAQVKALEALLDQRTPLQLALSAQWLALLEQWVQTNALDSLADQELIACFILAALPLVKNEIEPSIFQQLRRMASLIVPDGADLSGLTQALTELIISA